MRYILFAFAIALLPVSVHAQQDDSRFDDYEAYVAFVEKHMKARDVIGMLKRLGGRDEYTAEEMQATERQFLGIWRRDFENSTVFNRQDLGGGFSREARAYWTGLQYGYFYALLHERDDALIVLNFSVNTLSGPIMEKF